MIVEQRHFIVVRVIFSSLDISFVLLPYSLSDAFLAFLLHYLKISASIRPPFELRALFFVFMLMSLWLIQLCFSFGKGRRRLIYREREREIVRWRVEGGGKRGGGVERRRGIDRRGWLVEIPGVGKPTGNKYLHIYS